MLTRNNYLGYLGRFSRGGKILTGIGGVVLASAIAVAGPGFLPSAVAGPSKALANTAGPPTTTVGVQPTYNSGNITSCPGGQTALINTADVGSGSQSASYSNGTGFFDVTTSGGTYISFTTNIQKFVVYVKGGPAWDTYDYSTTYAGTTADTGLHSPYNNGGQIAGLSHYLVCGNPNVTPPPTFPTVFVGYADAEHGSGNHTPGSPWPPTDGTSATLAFAACPQGSATQNYVTCGTTSANPNDYDSGTIDLRNSTATAIAISSVTVTVNTGTTSQCTFDIWPHGTMSVPATGNLVLAQTGLASAQCGNGPVFYNFDTSDTQITECVQDSIAPVITVTLGGGGGSRSYSDNSLTMLSGGDDPGSCPATTSDETLPWTTTTVLP